MGGVSKGEDGFFPSGRNLTGGTGRDLLFGGAGDDTVTGNGGNDYMEGGAGRDRFVFNPGDGWDCIGDFQSGTGGDVLDASNWKEIGGLSDLLAMSRQDADGLVLEFSTRDSVKLMGMTADMLTADNVLFAGSAGKQISGGSARDLLFGGAGDDTVTGNGGNDYMEGGAGRDRFVFNPGDGWDCIGDFQSGTGGDVLDLRGWQGIGGFAELLAGSHQDADGLVLTFAATDSVKLMGVTADMLTADNVLLGSDAPSRAIAVFVASDAEHGEELWGSDGTKAFLLRDIAAGATNSEIIRPVSAGGRVFFSADDGVHGRELWMTDGTTAGTRMVSDILPGSGGSNPLAMSAFGDRVLFQADDGVNGIELWVSDGTAAGTHLLKDIDPGAASSRPGDFTQVGNSVYFSARDAEHGAALWKTDGTTAGTVMVKDFLPGNQDPPVMVIIQPSHLTAADDRLYLTAWDGTDGFTQLWVTDGTEAGTTKLRGDLTDLPQFGLDLDIGAVGTQLYFNDSVHLWTSDGTVEGTREVRHNYPDTYARPRSFTAAGDTLYYVNYDRHSGNELMATDDSGTSGTFLGDLNPGPNSSMPRELTAVGDMMYFAADDGTTTTLWQSGGHIWDTRKVVDAGGDDRWSSVTDLSAVGGDLYFSAKDEFQADAMFRLDVASGEVTRLAGAYTLPYGGMGVAMV
ncbi:ELWxxDGT repeat protein [Azospirillum sp. B21]|uniref:ELWxxDGT repeat protein n=1 Tax=Azospirillum sp. B21 TaxID=2607496 RepID=UPI00165F7836|nr:ELWxxDGT repeat protein [Azospirillum sp. B21]